MTSDLPLEALAAQLEKLKKEAELLRQVSVQLEQMASSLSADSRTMDELLALIRQLEEATDHATRQEDDC